MSKNGMHKLNKKEVLGLLTELPLLDKDEFWIMTGASLVLQNIIPETRDLDLGVSSKLFREVKSYYGSQMDDQGREYINYRSNVTLYPMKRPEHLAELYGYNLQRVGDIQQLYFERQLGKDQIRLAQIDKYLREKGLFSVVRVIHDSTEIDIGRILAVGSVIFGAVCAIGGIKNRNKMPDLSVEEKRKYNAIGTGCIAALTAINTHKLWNSGLSTKITHKNSRMSSTNNNDVMYDCGKVIKVTKSDERYDQIFHCDVELKDGTVCHYESTANEKVRLGDKVHITYVTGSNTITSFTPLNEK